MLVTFERPFTIFYSTALNAGSSSDRSPGVDPDVLANTPTQRPATPLFPFIAVPLPVFRLVQPYNISSTSFGSLLPLYTRGEGPPPYQANVGLGLNIAPGSGQGGSIFRGNEPGLMMHSGVRNPRTIGILGHPYTVLPQLSSANGVDLLTAEKFRKILLFVGFFIIAVGCVTLALLIPRMHKSCNACTYYTGSHHNKVPLIMHR